MGRAVQEALHRDRAGLTLGVRIPGQVLAGQAVAEAALLDLRMG